MNRVTYKNEYLPTIEIHFDHRYGVSVLSSVSNLIIYLLIMMHNSKHPRFKHKPKRTHKNQNQEL